MGGSLAVRKMSKMMSPGEDKGVLGVVHSSSEKTRTSISLGGTKHGVR